MSERNLFAGHEKTIIAHIESVRAGEDVDATSGYFDSSELTEQYYQDLLRYLAETDENQILADLYSLGVDPTFQSYTESFDLESQKRELEERFANSALLDYAFFLVAHYLEMRR